MDSLKLRKRADIPATITFPEELMLLIEEERAARLAGHGPPHGLQGLAANADPWPGALNGRCAGAPPV